MTDAIRKPITWVFNVALFLFIAFVGFAEYLVDSDASKRVPMDAFFDRAPGLAVAAAIILLFLLIVLAATILRAFWNRFVSDIFPVRNIVFREAVAIVLMITLLSAL